MFTDVLSDKVTLYQGDVLQTLAVLADSSAEAVLTDPPYFSGGVGTTARQAGRGAV